MKGINANKVRKRDFNLTELQKYKQGLEELQQWDLIVSTDYKLTTDKLEHYIVSMHPDFVVIDHLGLMTTHGSGSLYEKITDLSRRLKIIATEHNIPMLILVQLNRDIKQRQNKRPILSDIRESGAIEQDSDFVIFVHRQSVYDEFAPENEIELIVAKNRHGKGNRIVKMKINIETQEVLLT